MPIFRKIAGKLFCYAIVTFGLLGAAAASSEVQSVEITKGAAKVPLGIYVMVRSSQLTEDQSFGMQGLVEILKHRWVTAIALGLHWDVIFPEHDTDSFDALNALLKKIQDASKRAGRDEPVPIFLKVYPVLPPWMNLIDSEGKKNASPHTSGDIWSNFNQDVFTKDKSGITVISRPTKKDATGREVPGRNYPVSTDPGYQEQLVKVMDKISRWLEFADPNAIEFRLVHVIGPGMESNTMRPLAGSVFLAGSSLPEGINWSKEALIDAWINVTTKMARFPAFKKRCWVFNITNLSSRQYNSNGFSLTLDDQLKVVNALRAAHPLGKDAILLKTEDLTVDFNKVAGSSNIFGRKALWRNQYLNAEGYPYHYIASTKLRHGWELWSSFYNKRDKRSPSLYPISQLIENSLYSDLENSNPHVPQGTLWVEIWPDEVLHAPEIKTDRSGTTFDQLMQAWHDKLVELIDKRTYEGHQN